MSTSNAVTKVLLACLEHCTLTVEGDDYVVRLGGAERDVMPTAFVGLSEAYGVLTYWENHHDAKERWND